MPSPWTNLLRQFEDLLSGKVELHYKFLGQSPHCFGYYPAEPVTSFKAIASKANGPDSEMSACCREKGIEMPKGVPTIEPGIAEKDDLSEPEDADKTSSTQDR